MRPSIDPLASLPRPTTFTPGNVFTVSSADELQTMLDRFGDKLVVLMCKASHCKPCKRFAPTYQRIAQQMPDTVLLEIMGDETPVRLLSPVTGRPTGRPFLLGSAPLA